MDLPLLPEGAVVRCPVRNSDGTPIDPDDILGCGSANVVWSGDMYDCLDCGIFFAPDAADPPHRRKPPTDAVQAWHDCYAKPDYDADHDHSMDH